MFPWNIAKSAEAMFARWTIKRVCKFLLKKKLGQFILGEIDLNQLDVQLSAGTIRLSDLALNVDYLNQKIGAATTIIVKEGSIGSLLFTMPWKGTGCEIEVEEMELVLGPCGDLEYQHRSQASVPRQYDNSCLINKLENEKLENTPMSASAGVHEGVKTVAKIVKWLLTTFHLKVKKLIVAFDNSLVQNGDKMKFCRTLVVRINEVECGACISEEVTSKVDATVDNFLGLNRLTNFVKFQGAVLEFLHIDGVYNQTLLPCASGTTFAEWFSACCSSNARTPIVTGGRGGFSGTLKLSIPWNNGSLDIRKVDVDAYIDPVELRFQPSSIKWFLELWETIKDSGESSREHAVCTTKESVYFNSVSHLSSSVTSNDMWMHCKECSPFCSPVCKHTVTNVLLPESRLISDWVPCCGDKTQKDSTEEEPDFGASVDQFFECFDGMRNSQTELGNSGMWNWTCSVISAITAASNLASGSLHVLSGHQNVETNVKATLAGISVLVSLLDGDHEHSCDPKGGRTNVGSCAHYLGAKFQDMVLVLQVCPQEITFKGVVEYIELNDHFSDMDDARDISFPGGFTDVESQMLMIQQMQAAVQVALPPFFSSSLDDDSEEFTADFLSNNSRMDGCIRRTGCKCIYRDDIIKVTLFRTLGRTHCQLTVDYSSSDRPTSFSLHLPPLVFWVNFHLINLVLGLLKEVESSFDMGSTRDGSASEGLKNRYHSSSVGAVKRSSHCNLMKSSSEEPLRGNIFLPNARVIFCFPSENGVFRSYSSWDQFIALELTSSLNVGEEKVQVTDPIPNFHKRDSLTTSSSLHLNMGNLVIYLITSLNNKVGTSRDGLQTPTFSAENILCSRNRRGHFSLVSVFWHGHPVTGPWITQRAKLLATSKDSRGRNSFAGKGYEFASVNTAKDMEDLSDLSRKELILSSAFFLHFYLAPVKINLRSSQYRVLHSLLQQATEGLSRAVQDPINVGNDSAVSQTSILVECDSVEISVILEMVESNKGSIRSELPGSWHHFNLQIEKFQFLSLSNVGGICGANFIWVSHGEGHFWGSITGVPDKEFLLISCTNSTMGRGDGEGSNALSSKFAGSDIIHLWDPETSCSYLSITVRCSTLVAIGGRMDWLDAVISFFSLPSENEQSINSLKNGTPAESVPCECPFVLNLVDVGLSYEPYLQGLIISEVLDSETSSLNLNGRVRSQYVACLLAASSLKLSHSKAADCITCDYKVIVQDLGLLLCLVPGPENVAGTYSVEHLHKVGYVKVAREAHFEANLRMNCENDLVWELECSESHVFVDTCHDTTSGLIHLAAQLQQLFAPDVEESIIHLQTRWNNVQKTHESDGSGISNSDYAPTSKVNTSHLGMKSQPGALNLMDEICKDAFHWDGQWDGLSDSFESQLSISVDDRLLEETINLISINPESVQPNFPLESSRRSLLQVSSPEFIDGYFLTELRSMSKLSQEKKSAHKIPRYKSRNNVKGDIGWYGNASVNILEDHVSNVSTRSTTQQLVVEEATTSNCDKFFDYEKMRGRVLFKKINVIWRMYAGSDWRNFQKNVQNSPIIQGRDRTVCLELALSGMEFQYEVYPDDKTFVSRLSLSVHDFHLSDNSHDAPWKLVVGYYQSKGHPRKSSSQAFKLDLETVRPDPLTPLEEYRLRVSFLPLLLHLHQSQLDFLISFFGEKNSSVDQWTHDLSQPDVFPEKSGNIGDHTIIQEALLPYFQKFDVWPGLVRIDYIPCRVDLTALRGGKYVELVNLVPWKGVELQLKHVHAVGVYGWGSVCEIVVGEWLEDISRNQVRKILRGLPPIRSLVAVGSGAAKLVSLPMKNYKKDHRLVKGLQRGTIAFLRSISVEAVGLGVHLAAGAHDILLQAEYILRSIPPSVPLERRTKTNVRSNQPKNAKQGIRQAYESISDGLGKSASALVRTPLKRYQRGDGAGSAFVSAVQAAPAAAIAPASAAARALHCALLGVRNSLDPEHRKESIEKYLGAA